jgi:hypothetical protein
VRVMLGQMGCTTARFQSTEVTVSHGRNPPESGAVGLAVGSVPSRPRCAGFLVGRRTTTIPGCAFSAVPAPAAGSNPDAEEL